MTFLDGILINQIKTNTYNKEVSLIKLNKTYKITLNHFFPNLAKQHFKSNILANENINIRKRV